MSSSSIYAEMMACNSSAEVLASEIRKLKEKIEGQEKAISAYVRYRDNFASELEERHTNSVSAIGYNTVAVMSVRFETKKEADFSASHKNSWIEEAESLEKQLRDNYNTCLAELSDKKSQLQSLAAQMTQLKTDYSNALAQEESERQAAAARYPNS